MNIRNHGAGENKGDETKALSLLDLDEPPEERVVYNAMSESPIQSAPAIIRDASPPEPQLAVPFHFSPNLPEILSRLNVSLVVSTYQAGKVLSLGSHNGELKISFLDFEQAMGLAADRTRLAIGSRRQINFLHSAREIAPRIAPEGTHDGCWAMRQSRYTGNIHSHDLAWGRDGLWVVNTLFSCLSTLDEGYSFVPRWRPPFVSQLIDQDRCHLNGLAMRNEVPALAQSYLRPFQLFKDRLPR